MVLSLRMMKTLVQNLRRKRYLLFDSIVMHKSKNSVMHKSEFQNYWVFLHLRESINQIIAFLVYL